MLLWHRALLILATLLRRHLGRKDAGGNRVDADLQAGLGDLRGEHLVEVDGGALAGVVREVALRDLDHAADGGDVDDGARVAVLVLGGLLQEGQERGGHEVGADDVGGVDVGPFLDAVGMLGSG